MALAQQPAGDGQPVYTAPPATNQPPPATNQPPPNGPAVIEAEEKDSVRFRGGISAGGGFWVGGGLTAFLGGVDGRLGVQINKLIGVYAQPHLSFGVVDVGRGLTGATGVAAVSALAEVTLIDRIFIGAGGGGGVLNNPGGGMLHFRAGAYPLMGKGKNGRRQGLMIGADIRLVFLSGLSASAVGGTVVVMPFFSVGYEAY